MVVVVAGICCFGAAAAFAWHLKIKGRGPEEEKMIGSALRVSTPLGLPPLPIPANNPVTAEKVALGRVLFYDKRLSSDNSVSCSTCHNPVMGFTDGAMHSTGVGGKTGKRNALGLMNAAYNTMLFWDGRAPTLEAQIGTPMEDPDEMNQTHAVSVAKLQEDPAMKAQFAAAFGPGPVTIGKIEKAIASFERVLISGNAPFDRYQYGGDKAALSPAAVRGLAVFQDPRRGNCVTCHTVGPHYALFTDGKFHNTGEGVDGEGNLTDLGRFVSSGIEADKGAFKTPSLRNVDQSAPYMHDGKLKTLRDVVDFYAGGGNSNPYLDKEMKAIHLTAAERSDLVEFLRSLSGEAPADAGPPQGGK